MKSRIDKIMKAMIKGNLDAIAVIAGPNMAYLTGGDFFLMERPTVLIFSKNQRPLAILPSLEVDSFQALNFDSEIVAWKDSEGYLDAFVKEILRYLFFLVHLRPEKDYEYKLVWIL